MKSYKNLIKNFHIDSFLTLKEIVKEFENKGTEFTNEKNFVKAKKNFDKSIDEMSYKDPVFASSFFYRGLCRYFLCQYDEAVKDLSFAYELVKLDCFTEHMFDRQDALFIKSLVYECQGKLNIAIKWLTKTIDEVIENDDWCDSDAGISETYELYFLRANLLKRIGRYYDALSDLVFITRNTDKDFSSNPKDLSFVKYFELAIEISWYLNDLESKEYFINRFLKIHSSESECLFLQGKIYLENNNFSTALDKFKKIKQKEKTYPLIDNQINRTNCLKQMFIKSKNSFDNFETTSIINFKPWDPLLGSDFKYAETFTDQDLKSFFSNQTKYNNFENKKNWHIKNLSDFVLLIDNIKKMPRFSVYRDVDELCLLLEIIFKENIDLYITIESESGKVAYYDCENNCIVLNGDLITDIDKVCTILSHELIHFFQLKEERQILGLEIEDSIVDTVNLFYEDLSNIEFRQELEAWTYESIPYFVYDLYTEKNLIFKKFNISSNRENTIKWISYYKFLPNKIKNSKIIKKINYDNLLKRKKIKM